MKKCIALVNIDLCLYLYIAIYMIYKSYSLDKKSSRESFRTFCFIFAIFTNNKILWRGISRIGLIGEMANQNGNNPSLLLVKFAL